MHKAFEEAEVKNLKDVQLIEEDDVNELPLKFMTKKKLRTFLKWVQNQPIMTRKDWSEVTPDDVFQPIPKQPQIFKANSDK